MTLQRVRSKGHPSGLVYQEPQSLAIGTIPVDPSDDAGDGSGISNLGETSKPDR